MILREQELLLGGPEDLTIWRRVPEAAVSSWAGPCLSVSSNLICLKRREWNMAETRSALKISKMPIRVGVYDSVDAADRAVNGLLIKGFTEDEVTVFCSGEKQQRHFERFEPPATTGPAIGSAIMGSALGSALGGLTAIAGLMTIAGIPVLVAGGMAGMLTGGVVGGLGGAMMKRGFEKESADFFDQAVADGNILVAVELAEPVDRRRLDEAAEILAEAGADPVPLREG
jgi:hypothetical protein